MIKNNKKTIQQYSKAQATLEFVFSIFVIFLIFYSCVRVLQWVGIAILSSSNQHGLVAQNPPSDFDHTYGASWAPLNEPDDSLPNLRVIFQGNLETNP